ncbi:response regulator [Paenisporosarcina cavernae]|uniref:Response regulator n=1 Tax=Paenisporosarcina cavernae TaxID=2320858 RepID=A0A385YT19_9BACL|nr:response regulator [Paenisporosarcina cavernae]AYC28828.1 response regulator [Paenisporosarcina cavernae]
METTIWNTRGAEQLFNVLQGTLVRLRMPITLARLVMKKDGQSKEAFLKLNETLRQEDILFREENESDGWLLMPSSGERELAGLCDRFKKMMSHTESVFQRCVFLEVHNGAFELRPLLEELRKVDIETEMAPNFLQRIDGPWSEFTKQIVKVSIIEDDELIREVISRSLSSMEVPRFEMVIQEFSDGLSFEQSDWHLSADPHIVILDDVLPKKNEIEIVHYLRNRPNNRKFHLYLLTSRGSEEHTVNAYRLGVDEVIQKPFNLRLFEALLSRTIERL